MLSPTAPFILRLNQWTDALTDITELQSALGTKQDLLVSGTNIKTINGQSILGSGDLTVTEVSFDGLVFVQSLSDLPTPVLGVIVLQSKICYYFLNELDLQGNRLICQPDVVILGTSSENCKIYSTGLTDPLISTNYTLVIRHITFTATTVFDIDGFGNTCALDWTGVNFLDCQNIGTIKNFQNFVYDKGAFLNSSNLIFDGTSNTIAINNSLLSGRSTGTIISIPNTTTVSVRFRITYSSIVVPSTTSGIDFDGTVLTESFILDTVNFSGSGTYLTGLTATSNLTLFSDCKGIANTAINGQMYMRNNTITTTISNTTDFFKVAGITIPNPDNAKYTHSNNRLTNDAAIERKFFIQATISFTSGNNNVVEFGFYDSKAGVVRPDSIIIATANSAGRAENIKIQTLVSHKQGDYIEVWCRNTSSVTNITVSSLNVIIIES